MTLLPAGKLCPPAIILYITMRVFIPITQRIKKRLHERERYHARARQGLCTRCGKPAVPGFRLCAKHSYMLAEYSRRWRMTHSDYVRRTNAARVQWRRDNNRCVCCGAPREGPRRICHNCNTRTLYATVQPYY